MLEDLDFADDIALLSSKISDLQEKTGRLAEEAARVGLKRNARKCKTLRGLRLLIVKRTSVVNGEEVEDVEEFVYLGATINKEGGGSRDITNRLQKTVVERADVNDISCEARRRRWSWLGHILRKEGANDCFTALGWTPEGRRARGRPKTTCRRTVEKERNKAGWKSWEVAKAKAVERNRECWKA